jgi:hypothetical protein
MKRILFLGLLLFFAMHSIAQNEVKWSGSYNSASKQVELKAEISEGWHLYSQFIQNDVGPVPTTFSFKSSDDFQLTGAVAEPKAIQKYDPNFEATLNFFEKEVIFTQNIKPGKESFLEVTVTFMVCNETMCLPPVDQKIRILIPSK